MIFAARGLPPFGIITEWIPWSSHGMTANADSPYPPTGVILGLDPRIHTVSYPRMQKRFWVYILTTRKGGTLYTGVTSDLPRRLFEHTHQGGSKFTSRYSLKRLVWYEEHAIAPQAIAREKAIKRWPRKWKIELIETINPDWFDLGRDLNR